MASAKLDPITLQVISGALDTIAEEMGHVLYRMSFSSIIRESQDLGAGLFDTDFNTLCESESTPLHIGSLPGYLYGIKECLGDTPWNEGDVIIHNHPYYGASHSPDIAIVIPIFHENALVGFAANTAHHVDIGAATPGLIIDIPDVFAEGMLFAGTKLYEGGKRNEAVWDYIGRNSRAARQLQDDLDAQIASARLGVKRFVELIERYGRDVIIAATQQLMDYTETILRQKIAAIPNGTYRAEGFLDDDGKNRGVRLPVKVAVRILDDSVEVDLTGSADQVETGFNVPFEGSTKVACFCAMRSLLLDAETSGMDIPSNEGSFRPIKVIAPKGSIFNPEYPAAAEARFTQCNRMIDLIYKALAPVLPNDIIAGSSASLSFVSYSGIRDSGDYWVFLEVNEGAYGGRPASDGPDSIDNLMANTRNNPLEDLSMHLPMICERYELRDDVNAGAGRYRGGIGVVKSQRVFTEGYITHESERHTDIPWGAFGGEPGATGQVLIYDAERPDDYDDMPAKFSGLKMKANHVMEFRAPCGGGYGDPLERPAEQVLEDVLDDFCSEDYARDAYGVVLDLDAETVETAATEALRQKLRAARRTDAPLTSQTPTVSAAVLTRSSGPKPKIRMESDAASVLSKPTPVAATERPVAPSLPRPDYRSIPSRARENGKADRHGSADEALSLADVLARLKQKHGREWSFDIVYHGGHNGSVEVVGELRANGSSVQREAVLPVPEGTGRGNQLVAAADESLRQCALAILAAS